MAAISGDIASINGPPSSLGLFSSQYAKELQETGAKRLEIPGLLHAPHLPKPSLDAILGDDELWNMPLPASARTLAISSGQLLKGHPHLRDLLQECLTDLLQSQASLSMVCETLRSVSQDSKLHIITFGGTEHAGCLQTAIPNLVTQSCPLNVDPALISEPANCPIAIVGMAGRFPGADSPEELWELLLEGLDMHKEVGV